MCRCLRILESCCQHFLETLQPFDTENENEIANYLYNRSKEIEPKNCKKPPNKDRKWPLNYTKSPGIKLRSKGIVPNPLPTIFQSERGTKLSEGADGDDTPHLLTPPTPTTPTPCTPPLPQPQLLHMGANATVFAPIEIGTGNVLTEFRGTISGFPSNFLPPQAPPPPPASPQAPPPPLPPRVRKREPSIGDTSPKVKQAPDAPELPPRDVSPPPIPPRTSTLPRMHSSGGLQHNPTHHHHAPIGHNLHSISSLHHPHSHHHYSHHYRPTLTSLLAPPPQQYQLDPPPHRRNNSVDLSSPTPITRRHTNGPKTGLPGSSMNDTPTDPSDHPPTPPPRLSYRQTFSFPYDQHHS
ncbi:son of sevenless homolog 2-like [Procambarus clarkii]|uniref:son of sevenless homolog 2-like n=1 Tax=Procambarus clarkii TaxID=6728 RepID=UPI003742E2D4